MTSSSSRRFVNPFAGLPPELSDMDSRLSEAYLTERLLLPVNIARQVMMRLPRAVTPLVLAARWVTGLVLLAGVLGVALIHQYIEAAASRSVWVEEQEKGMFMGVCAILTALALCHAAPLLSRWTRMGLGRPPQPAAAFLAGEILCWRVGALALATAVCLCLA